MNRRVPRRFFARDAREVAPELLGVIVAHRDDDGAIVRARLVEVEAYAGERDPGSHAFRGRTARNALMFGPAGFLYVYFTYGMHWCMNVVCGAPGEATAVLLRAGEPVGGIDAMRARRPTLRRDRDLLAGPARFTKAFGIDGSNNGIDCCTRGSALWFETDGSPPPAVATSPRVGLANGRGEDLPWRYLVPDSPYVSRAPRPPPPKRLSPTTDWQQ